jgi:hypothetical protein
MIISRIDDTFDIELDDRLDADEIDESDNNDKKTHRSLRPLPPKLIDAEWIRCRILWIDNKTLELVTFILRPSTRLTELQVFDWSNITVTERIFGTMI